jgi:hypothetical protein
LFSAVIELLIVVALCTPWYRTELYVEALRSGNSDRFTVDKHPFFIYTSCEGDFCNLPGFSAGVHSWSEFCENGCSSQLTLYVMLWLMALALGIVILFSGVKLLWSAVAVNRDRRQCALFLFKCTPLYGIVLVTVLFIIVISFPTAVPAAMGNDGECNELESTGYNSPCRHAFGDSYYYGNYGKNLEVYAKWGPAEAWYLLLCALIISIVVLPLGCIIGVCAGRAATSDDINVFVPPTGGFDYYPVDTTGNQQVPVQSFDQYVPGYNPSGSFTLN